MPHSLNPSYLRSLSFSAEDASTLQKIGEYKGKQALFTEQTPEVLDSLRQVAIVESSESSNRLEGITAPRERVEALVRKTSMPATRSEQEIAGYRDALALIHESANDMALTVNVILQVHSIIYRYLPNEGGRWKMADNEIVERRIAPFAISEVEAECPGISRDMIRVVLRQMREEGALSVSGAGRAARWSRKI